jgi:raffinose/stachyose/melibiose transport system permease protein
MNGPAELPAHSHPRVSTVSTAVRPRSRVGRSLRAWGIAGLFMLPALSLYALFVLFPIVQAARFSLYDWNGLEALDQFIGLANFQRALSDPVFLGAIGHNTLIVVLSLVVQIPFALGLALMLNRRFRGRAILRLLFFAPYVIAEVITAIVWSLILQPNGLADHTLTAVGLENLYQPWLADPDTVLIALFFVITWKYFGFHMILLLAGLQGIPREVDEAAAIDGASRWQTIRYVTLPLLGPTIRVSVFLSIIGAIQLFDLVWVTTRGGPVNASNTMAVYMFDRGFVRFQFGYGSAVAVILFLLCFVLALAYQRWVLRRDTEGATTYG